MKKLSKFLVAAAGVATVGIGAYVMVNKKKSDSDAVKMNTEKGPYEVK